MNPLLSALDAEIVAAFRARVPDFAFPPLPDEREWWDSPDFAVPVPAHSPSLSLLPNSNGAGTATPLPTRLLVLSHGDFPNVYGATVDVTGWTLTGDPVVRTSYGWKSLLPGEWRAVKERGV